MKDFSRFCLAVADDEGWLPEMEMIFGSVTEEQSQISIQANPLYSLLRLAIGKDAQTLSHAMSALELGRRLDQIAAIAQILDPTKNNPKSLSRLLGEAKTEFENAIGMRISKDRKMKINVYSFRPTEEIRDQCVAEWQRLSPQPPEEAAIDMFDEIPCGEHSAEGATACEHRGEG
jgi:hypothetical protein